MEATLKAETRSGRGKNEARRLRAAGRALRALPEPPKLILSLGEADRAPAVRLE